MLDNSLLPFRNHSDAWGVEQGSGKGGLGDLMENYWAELRSEPGKPNSAILPTCWMTQGKLNSWGAVKIKYVYTGDVFGIDPGM